MRTAFFVALSFNIWLSLLPSSTSHLRAAEPKKIAPASDGVELQEMQIQRQAVSNGLSDSSMELKLWFTSNWPKDVRSPLIHLQSLEAVEDDTGRVLSTKERRGDIFYLRGEVYGATWMQSGQQSGPEIRLQFDAPARNATRIKLIKGTAVVSATKTVALTFKDLAAIDGKILEHPDMKDLQRLKLRFSLKQEDGMLTAAIASPLNYASPWKIGRLTDDWKILEGKTPLRFFGLGTSPEGDGVTVEQTFERRDAKGLSLRIFVREPVQTRTFKFEFRDVPLP